MSQDGRYALHRIDPGMYRTDAGKRMIDIVLVFDDSVIIRLVGIRRRSSRRPQQRQSRLLRS